MSHSHSLRRALRRGSAMVAATAVVGTGAIFAASPAHASPQSVSDATLRWGINTEVGSGAFLPGTCNFLSAGAAGSTGSSRAWTEADGFYRSEVGNVRIVKPTADGGETSPTWATKCQNASGAPLSSSTASGNQVVLSNGTGTVDTAAGTASLSWDGDFTLVFYGGLAYWIASDPQLSVNPDGSGTLTATASGYGADMNDTSVWNQIPPTTIQLATFAAGAFELTETGVIAQPEYQGVEVTVPAGGTPQSRTGANWGAFPQSLIDFHGATGQASYWYSSGGSADPKKPALPATFGWTLAGGAEDPDPNPNPGNDEGVDITVTVPGSDPGDPGDPGALSWTIQGTGPVSLGTAQSTASGFAAAGNLHPVKVDDTRATPTAWSVNGQASAFSAGSASFGSQHLGWTPSLASNSANAVPGVAVAPGTEPGAGLSTSRTLVSTGGAATPGSVVVSTALSLQAPATTTPGAYTSTLTMTLVG